MLGFSTSSCIALSSSTSGFAAVFTAVRTNNANVGERLRGKMVYYYVRAPDSGRTARVEDRRSLSRQDRASRITIHQAMTAIDLHRRHVKSNHAPVIDRELSQTPNGLCRASRAVVSRRRSAAPGFPLSVAAPSRPPARGRVSPCALANAAPARNPVPKSEADGARKRAGYHGWPQPSVSVLG